MSSKVIEFVASRMAYAISCLWLKVTYATCCMVLEYRQLTDQVDGTRQASTDGYASTCCDLDL